MKRFIATLVTAVALVGGAVVLPVAAAAPAQAATCHKVWTGKWKTVNSVTCWLSPSNPACRVKVYATQCGGKF